MDELLVHCRSWRTLNSHRESENDNVLPGPSLTRGALGVWLYVLFMGLCTHARATFNACLSRQGPKTPNAGSNPSDETLQRASLASCSTQLGCLTWELTQGQTPGTCATGACEWTMCVTLSLSAEGCVKSATDTISH
eukprot:6481803-Amphidinium_carterae.2